MSAKGQRLPVSARFWAKVRFKTGTACWEWQGALDTGGYGVFTPVSGRLVKAHRFAWELECGAIAGSLMVCHRCDNRRCVRPDHLFLGTALDNLQDASAKGRLSYSPERRATRRGESNPNAKMTWEKARAIRARRTAGASFRQLMEEFEASMGTITSIVYGETWKEDQQPPSAA